MMEVVDDARVLAHLLLDAVDAESILGELDDSTAITCAENLIWLQPEIKFLKLEDLVELRDELHCELLLAHIVVCLNNNS